MLSRAILLVHNYAMKMKNLIYVTILISLQIWTFSLVAESTAYKLRMIKVSSCDNSNKTYIIKEMTVNRYDDQDHLYIALDLLEDVTVANMTVLIEKCDKNGENCDHFSKLPLPDVCTLFKLKNMFWSPMVDSIKPTPDCPVIKKGFYEMQNGTMNVDQMIKLFPDTSKHYWKMHGSAVKKDGTQFVCGDAEGYIE